MALVLSRLFYDDFVTIFLYIQENDAILISRAIVEKKLPYFTQKALLLQLNVLTVTMNLMKYYEKMYSSN